MIDIEAIYVIERVKSSEDYNFMGQYVFEKAELTYWYINYVISVFEQSGLNVHCVPFYVFLKFYSKEILNNSFLQVKVEASFARTLNFLGLKEKALSLL